jgi:hypothetical protein
MKHLALFTFISLAIGNVEASTIIVGSWIGQNLGSSQSTVVASLLADGEFFLYNEGNSSLDSSGQSGMEYGTYHWNSSTGAFTAVDIRSSVGGWQSMPFISKVSVTGNTLLAVSDNGVTALTSVPSVTNSFLGSWYFPNPEGAEVVTLLAGGKYFDVGYWFDPATNSPGQSIERGTYTFDSATGAYDMTALFATDGYQGPGGSSGFLTVTGDQMTVSFTKPDFSPGINIGTRVAPSAVPLPAAAWFFMTGLTGLFFNVRQKSRRLGFKEFTL